MFRENSSDDGCCACFGCGCGCLVFMVSILFLLIIAGACLSVLGVNQALP